MTPLELSCILHNRLGSLGQIAASEKGPNGAVTGVLNFDPVTFDDGVRADSASSGRITFNVPNIQDKCMIDLWCECISDAGSGTSEREVIYEWHTNNSNRIIFNHHPSFIATDNFRLSFITASGSFTAAFGFAYVADTPFHFLAAWDKDKGIEGAFSLVVYINGIKVFSTTSSFGVVAPFTLNGINRWTGGSPLGSQGFEQTYYDNIKLYDVVTDTNIADALANRNNEGFPVPVAIIIPVQFSSARPRVLILDDSNDRYEDIDSLQSIQENRTFQKDKLVINQISQSFKNQNNNYSVDNPISMFSGINWKYELFKIIDKNNVLTWNGVIRDIPRDHGTKKANIISTDILSKFQEEKIDYESATWEPPSTAALNILRNIGYPDDNLNLVSFDRSTNIYSDNDVLVMVNFNKSGNVKLQAALEKLGLVGFADVYMANNQINFVAFTDFTGGVVTTLNEKDIIKGSIKVDAPDSNMINEYIIIYSGSEIPATDTDNSNPIGTLSRKDNGIKDIVIDGGNDKQITIKDKVAADFIGRSYLKRPHRTLSSNPNSLIRIRFKISINNQSWTELTAPFQLNFKREGWDNKTFNPFKINKQFSQKIIDFTAFEVAS